MNQQKRKEMINLIPYTPWNPYLELSEQELLNRLEIITTKIHELEDKRKATSDRKIRKEIKAELKEFQHENSLVFQVLFKKYGYNISADEVCELLDMDLHYFFKFGKHNLLFQVKVTTGATQFIKDFIFKDSDEYGLRRDEKTKEIPEEVLYLQQFHRKKLFFKEESIRLLLNSMCAVVGSRMFLDFDLRRYADHAAAKKEVNKFLLDNGYSKIIKKEIYDRKKRTKSMVELLEAVNQPGSLFAITEQIFNEEIILQTTSKFKESFIRNYCKATYRVHDEQLKRVLEQQDNNIEFIKLGLKSTSSDLMKLNLRYFAREVQPVEANHYRIPLAWGTDTEELTTKLHNHLKATLE